MILGVMGRVGSGKDTFADVLVRDHGFVKIALADEMKRFLHTIGFPAESLWGPSEERSKVIPRFGKSARPALQALGTEWGRAYYLDLWVDRALEVARAVQAGQRYDQKVGLLPSGSMVGRSVVIPDCRFRNEFDAVHAVGGKMIRLRRPGLASDPHPSEVEQESIADHEFDHVYVNSGTIEDLERDLMEWIRCQNPNE